MKKNSNSPLSKIAMNLHKKEISFVPIIPREKKPGTYSAGKWYPMKNWNQYGEALPTIEEISDWMTWPDAGIGVVLGKISGIVALDFDYNIDGIHDKILEFIPSSPLQKTGAKGFTGFYRYNGEKTKKWNKDGKSVVELLSDGRQTVLPPSIHPDGSTYTWSNKNTLESFSIDKLPALPEKFFDLLDDIFEKEKKDDDQSCRHSNARITDIESALTYIPVDNYDLWIMVGMVLKDNLGERGFSIWDSWSRTRAFLI